MMAAAPMASLAVSDAAIVEGNDGIQYAAVHVSLSTVTGKTVQVGYNTADGTGKAGSDYNAASGTLTFAAGETRRTVLVPVKGDRLTELDEGFTVNLRGAKGAKVGDGQGVVTILDDEPRLSIGSLSAFKHRGDSGTTPFTFSVNLSAACDQPVTVNYATQDGSATAGVDYLAAAGTLTFAPGETSKVITVDVIGDPAVGIGTKTFHVNLTAAGPSVLVVKASSTGTIIQAPQPPNTYWDPTAYGSGAWIPYGSGDPDPYANENPYGATAPA